jgi:hypothetical protein
MADSDDSTEDVWAGWLETHHGMAWRDDGDGWKPVDPPGYVDDEPAAPPADDDPQHDGEQWYWGRRVVDVELP